MRNRGLLDVRLGTTTPPDTGNPTNPPIQGAYLTQSNMPSYDAAWALATAPIVTYATAPSVSGVTMAPNDSRVKLGGGATRGLVDAGGGYYRAPFMADIATPDIPFLPMYSAKIKTSSPVVEIRLRQRAGLGTEGTTTRVPVRVKVNGQWTSRLPTLVGPGNTGTDVDPSYIPVGTEFYLRLEFSGTVAREIELVTISELGSFTVPSGSSFIDPNAYRFKALVMGDSLFGGEKHGTGNYALSTSTGAKRQAATYTHLSSVWAYICQTLGYDNPINMGSGSSGYNISGDSVKYITAQRIADDVIAHAPSLVMVGSALNDLRSATPATLQGFTAQVQNAIKAGLPNAIRVVLGDPTPPSVTSLGQTAIDTVTSHNAAMKAAAQATGAWFLDPQAGKLYDPSGVVQWTGTNLMTGNAQYISSDGTHPTQLGADFFGTGQLAQALKFVHPVGSIVVNPGTGDPGTGNGDGGGSTGGGTGGGTTTPQPTPAGQLYGPQSMMETRHMPPRDEVPGRIFLAKSLSGASVTTAMTDALAWKLDNPTKNVPTVDLPDGEIVAGGSGSTATKWIQNVGTYDPNPDTADRRYIPIRPAGTYGDVRISLGTSAKPTVYDFWGNPESPVSPGIFNVHGFGLSQIDGGGASFSAKDSQMAFEYIGNLSAWNLYFLDATKKIQVEMTAIYDVLKPRVKKGDWGGLTGVAGSDAIVRQTGFHSVPIRVPPRAEDGSAWTSRTKPHSDGQQAKGGGHVTLYAKKCYGAANQNTYWQLGSTLTLDLEDSAYIGGEAFLDEMYPSPQEYLNEDIVFNIFNAPGYGGNRSRRTYVQGGMQTAVWTGNPTQDVATSLTTAEGGRAGWTYTAERRSIATLRKQAPVPNGAVLFAR